jgi:hypothetical protein
MLKHMEFDGRRYMWHQFLPAPMNEEPAEHSESLQLRGEEARLLADQTKEPASKQMVLVIAAKLARTRCPGHDMPASPIHALTDLRT